MAENEQAEAAAFDQMADGVHEGEGIIEVAEQVQAGRRIVATPDQLEIFFGRRNLGGGGSGESINYEMMFTGSTRPEEYLPRTRLTEEEISDTVRLAFDLNWASFGWVDMERLMWLFFHARQSLEGEARKEMVEVLTGQRRERFANIDTRSLIDRITRSRDAGSPQGQAA